MTVLSTCVGNMEKLFVDTINTRFEKTNGLVFEVLTAMASAPSSSHHHRQQEPPSVVDVDKKKAKERKTARAVFDKQKQKWTKPKKISMKGKASMFLRFQQAVTLDDFLDGYNAQLTMTADKLSLLTPAERSKRSSYLNY
ncbi:unnamed protein product [Bathycoccus prasinos]